MKTEQRDQIRAWFESYVDSFRSAGGNLPTGLVIKLEHSRRVAGNARDIARDLHWPPGEILGAETAGCLHDIGRFSQLAEFGHFHDATSVDHGLRGFEVLQESGILAQLPGERRRCLLESTRHHNARHIPAAVTPACLPLLKLVRDADKLDIYRVVSEELSRDGFQKLAGMWPHVSLRGGLNPRLLDDIRTRRTGDTADVRSLADFLLLQACWVYDLHYAPARERVRRGGLLEAVAARLPSDPETTGVLEEIRRFLSRDEDHAVSEGSSAVLRTQRKNAPSC